MQKCDRCRTFTDQIRPALGSVGCLVGCDHALDHLYTGIYASRFIRKPIKPTPCIAPGDPLDITQDPLGPPEGPSQTPWTPEHAPGPHWTLKITCSALLFIRGPPVMIIIYHHIILPLDFCTVYPRSSSGVRRFYVELSANVSRTKFASGLTGS